MRVTDEMVAAGIQAWEEAAGTPLGLPRGAVLHVLTTVAPLVRAAYAQELLDNAWSGSARGAIRGAMERAEEAYEAPPLGYRSAGVHRVNES